MTSCSSNPRFPCDRTVYSDSHPFRFQRPLRFLRLGCWVTLFCGGFFVTPHYVVAREKDSAPTRADVVEKQSDLKELRSQIEALRKEMAHAESQHAGAVGQLKNVEQEISSTQRELTQLSRQRNRLQATLNNLGDQSHALETRLANLRAQLETLVYRQYLRGRSDSLHLLFNGENPNQLARDLVYLSTISHSHAQMLSETQVLLEQKKSLANDAQERAAELSSVEAQQKDQHGKLLTQREQRKAVLNKLSQEISRQRKEISNLQRDEQQLTKLIDRLSKIIASRPASREGRTSASTSPGKPSDNRRSTVEVHNVNTPTAASQGIFPSLQGHLRLPVRGVVTNRFGGTRQEGSTWKGLFIRTRPGADIKAIAGGQVVFADWLRGFGNLLILDHGRNYLSVYGYNEALLKQVGDDVRGGDSIATAGNSGGNPESGLYFELRHRGQPIDPMKWVTLR